MENIELILKELEETYKRSYKKLASRPPKVRYLGVREKLEALAAGEFSIDWGILDSTADPAWPSAITFHGEKLPSDPKENESQIALTQAYRFARANVLFGNHLAAKDFLEKN